MRETLMAEPYRHGALHSFGTAQYMLMCQHDFPHTYEDREQMLSADSDRLFSWDYAHSSAVHQKYRDVMGDQSLESWLNSNKVNEIMAFIKELLKADSTIEWTGFRVLGTVNRSNGYTVWSYQLFAKDPKSKTKVYSGYLAPNVKRCNETLDMDGMGEIYGWRA